MLFDEPCLGFEKEEEEDKNDINPKVYMKGIYTQDKERERRGTLVYRGERENNIANTPPPPRKLNMDVVHVELG